MPEVERKKGEIGTRRVINLLEGLGWNHHGALGVDIDCTFHDKRAHGIDAYMTYDDPYRNMKRGVIIESKNYSLDSISPSRINDDFEQTLETLECAPESENFDELLNFNNANLVNAAILAIWIQEENIDPIRQKLKKYIQNISVPRKHRKAYQILVLGKFDLLRLVSLKETFKNIKDEDEDLKFYHPGFSDNDPVGNPTITIEELLSKYIFATSDSERKTIVFFFDEVSYESLCFMYYALRRYQLTEKGRKIMIYLYETRPQIDTIKQEFINNGPHTKTGGIEIKFKPFFRLRDLRTEEG